MDSTESAVPARLPAKRWPRLLSWVFAGEPEPETVVTRIYFETSPETVWRGILFYEEVPGKAPFLLRTFLPCPLRTDGTKNEVGAIVFCFYSIGDLVKRITAVESPRLIEFEVLQQSLGIEGCVHALGGSYEIHRNGEGSEIALTTNYSAFLRPRGLWRPVEKLVTNQLHRHVLNGIRMAICQKPEPVMASR
jgi:hypothetical protein